MEHRKMRVPEMNTTSVCTTLTGVRTFGYQTETLKQARWNSCRRKRKGLPGIIVEICFFFFLRFYLFIFSEGKGGRKRGIETSMCGCLSSTPNWGPGQQPRHVS